MKKYMGECQNFTCFMMVRSRFKLNNARRTAFNETWTAKRKNKRLALQFYDLARDFAADDIQVT